MQSTTRLPKKRQKGKPLTKEEKQANRAIAKERVLNENVIGCLKRFKILTQVQWLSLRAHTDSALHLESNDRFMGSEDRR